MTVDRIASAYSSVPENPEGELEVEMSWGLLSESRMHAALGEGQSRPQYSEPGSLGFLVCALL